MKRIIALLIIAASMSTQAYWPFRWLNGQHKQETKQSDDFVLCHDVIQQIEAGAPYAHHRYATKKAKSITVAAAKSLDATIEVENALLKNSVLSDEDKKSIEQRKEEAKRVFRCAQRFHSYGVHYTKDAPLREFFVKFNQAQNDNTHISQQAFLDQHVEQQNKAMDEKQRLVKDHPCADLFALAARRLLTQMANGTEKKEAGAWLPLFDACQVAHLYGRRQ